MRAQDVAPAPSSATLIGGAGSVSTIPRPLIIEPWNRSKTETNGGFRAKPLALDNPYYRALKPHRDCYQKAPQQLIDAKIAPSRWRLPSARSVGDAVAALR